MHPLVAATVLLLAVTAAPYLLYLGLYAVLRPGEVPVPTRDAEPAVSVVLPTYNEERIVERKLDDVVALDYPMEKVEVVVVDSSDDATRDVVRDFFAERSAPSLTLLEEPAREGVASAVNRALDAATGEVVFRTDCDSTLSPDAVREAVETLAVDGVGGVTGRQVEVLGDSQVEAEYRSALAKLQALETRLDSTFICHGPCFAFRRDAFSPIAADSLADDTEIGVGVRRRGERVVMNPAMEFAESGVSAFTERRLRKDRRAMGLVQLLVRNADMLGGYGRFGRVVLPFNWWFMVVSPWLCVALALLLTASAGTLAAGVVGGLGGALAALAVPLLALLFFWAGQRDALGPLQSLYAVADAQVSLLVAQVRLARSDATGVWDVDRESRDVFE